MIYIIALSQILLFNEPFIQGTPDYIYQTFESQGLNGEKALKVALCESRLKLNSVGYNSNGSNDKGVWQINSIHKLPDECRLDLKCSTQWVINKVKHDGNWSAWTCDKLTK